VGAIMVVVGRVAAVAGVAQALRGRARQSSQSRRVMYGAL
jgi:hypothetical protein